MHARVGFYELVSGDFDELAGRTASELGGILAKKPGFVSYRLGQDANGNIVVVNEWETREQAEAAIPAAAAWVKDNIADNVRLIQPSVIDFKYNYQP